MKKIQLALVACGVALLAAGCGGGGGGSTAAPAAAKVSITTTNAAAVSKGAVSTSTSTAKSGSGAASTVGVVVQPTAPQQSLINIALSQIKRVESLKLPMAPAGVIGVSITGFPITLSCSTFTVVPAGTANSETVDIQGATASSTTFTSASITFNACVSPSPVAVGATETLNGAFSMTVSSQTGAGTAASPKISSIAMTFTNFSSVEAVPGMANNTTSIAGGFTIATSNNGTILTATMSGTSLAMTSSVDGAFTLKNFSIVDSQDAPGAPVTGNYSESFTMTTNCAALNGDIDITTPVPFTGTGAANPTAGQMVITGANGSSITLTAKAPTTAYPAGYVIQVVNDTSTTPATVTTTNVLWSQL